MLTDNGTGALAVDVEVTGSVAESVICLAEGLAVLREHGSGQTILASLVNLLADLGEVGLGGVVVGVDDKDGTEELTGQKRVIGVGSVVDGRLNVPALGGVVGTTSQELELRVVLGLVDHLRQLVERSLMDDRTAEVGKIGWLTDLELLGLGGNLLQELIGDGSGDVCAGSSTALLSLEFEGSTDGLDDRVADIGRLVNEVEVLSAGFTNNARVAAVLALSNAVGDLAIEATEHAGATSEVKSSELGVVEDSVGNLLRVTRDELDDILRETSLQEDLVNEPVGRNGGRRGLPDNDITHQSRGTSQVAANGSEVERTDSIDESLQGTVLDTAGSC